MGMGRKIKKLFLGLLLGLAVIDGIAWLHSSVAGYERTWSNPANQTCGRFISAQGRLLWQQCACDLETIRPPDVGKGPWKAMVPPGFFMGGNPKGEQTIIQCGPHAVPFAFPGSGTICSMRMAAALSDVDSGTMVYWSYAWREYTVAYWLILALILVILAVEGIKWLLNRRKSRSLVQAPIN